MAFVPKRYAAVDIGTNTIKIQIADLDSHGNIKKAGYKDFPSCLAKNTGISDVINIDVLPDCIASLDEIKRILKEQKVDSFECIATHALRTAKNQKEVVDIVKAKTGLGIKVISGEEEARLTLLAVLADVSRKVNFACINVGGGSTELSFHLQGGNRFFSFDFGAVNFFDKIKNNSADFASVIKKAGEFIKDQYQATVSGPPLIVDKVFGTGGSIFNAAYIYKKDARRNFDTLNGLKIPASGLMSVIDLLKQSTGEQKKNIPGIDMNRLESILPGVLIHYFLLNILNKDEVIISTRTISDGIIYEMAHAS